MATFVSGVNFIWLAGFRPRARRADPLILSSLALALFNFGVSCAAPLNNGSKHKFLFRPITNRTVEIEEAKSPRIIRHQLVEVEFELLSGTVTGELQSTRTPSFLLNLFDDTFFSAILDRREVRSNDSFTWFGRVEGIDNSQITLVAENGVLVGNIRVQDALYQVRYAGEGLHVVYQIDSSTFPPDSPPLIVPGGH